MISTNKVFKIILMILLIHRQTGSCKLIRSVRSIKSVSNSVNNLDIKCQAYSYDGDCLGDIYVSNYGDKCDLCPRKCYIGHKKDQSGKCRKIHDFKATTAKPKQKCYLGFICF
ncbi:hypothetical protein ACKWTF_006125 [Chironomus riparius]